MNIYTLNRGINAKLATVEDDVEALVVSTGTLEDDIESLVTAVGTLEDDIETLTTAAGALTTAMTPTITDTEQIDVALTVSGGETPSLTITDVPTQSAKTVAIQVHNKGDATTVTVNIFGKIGNLAYTVVPEIAQVTLNASTTENDIIIPLTGTPLVPYDAIKIVIANTDVANATTVDAVVRVIV